MNRIKRTGIAVVVAVVAVAAESIFEREHLCLYPHEALFMNLEF
jgi:hypothetical protein